MHRLRRFPRCLVITIFLCAASLLHSASEKPNILWLIGEDFSPNLSCYGETLVQTPNLDKLAAEGMRFTRAFTTAPVCSASRSAFMTGMYQTTIGAHHHRSHRDDGYKLPEGVRVLTDHMRDAGYFTANLKQLPASCGFKGAGKTDWNFTYEGQPFDSDNWADLKSHQPFMAQINFQETHRTFHGEKKVDPAKVSVPPIYPDHPVTREDWARYLDAAMELDRKIGLVLQALEAEGLAENTIIMFMGDHGMAHVRGKQFCYDDGLRIPLIMRWPKSHTPPAHFKAGTVSEQFIEAIDLAPTLLTIAGGKIPAKMQGRAFLGDHAGPARQMAFGARDRCDTAVFRFRTVRDARYRYIKNFMPEVPFLAPSAYKERQYPVWNLIKELGAEGKLTDWQKNYYLSPTMPAEELYDMEMDSWSMNNLVGSDKPEHQAALKKLRSALEKWLVESDDQGRFPEPAEVAARGGATKPGADFSTKRNLDAKAKRKSAADP
jgi:N-sulfoglucosamine sulfohydrolase